MSARVPLTKRQHVVYAMVAEYIGKHGYAPSLDEIAKALHYRSPASVHEHVCTLERKGWITRLPTYHRGIALAGEPSLPVAQPLAMCSFCKANREQPLVSGDEHRVFICRSCVARCVEIFDKAVA